MSIKCHRMGWVLTVLIAGVCIASPPVLQQAAAQRAEARPVAPTPVADQPPAPQVTVAEQPPADPPPAMSDRYLTIEDLNISGQIDGQNITFTLGFTAIAEADNRQITLFGGDLVLLSVDSPDSGYRLGYDAKSRRYTMTWPSEGRYEVSVRFAARPTVCNQPGWQQVEFVVPSSQKRELSLSCDRVDLEVQFPGAMRVERRTTDQRLHITAIQGPGRPFAVRWKPQVQAMDAKLVASAQANTIARVAAGALRMDYLFAINIAQGRLTELTFDLPENLSIIQVRGNYIRDWSTRQVDNQRQLHVVINRPQTNGYAIQISADMMLGEFPLDLEVPSIQPVDMRTAGHLVIGTDSAIQLIVDKTLGLSQIEGATFPRMMLSRQYPRPLPSNKALFYQFATGNYQASLRLDDISPSYDASHRLVAQVKEDDLTIEGQLELDIRDAPLRSLSLKVPGRFVVAAVSGDQVDDYRVVDLGDDGPGKRVDVQFTQPTQGRCLLGIRLELAASPLNARQTIGSIDVAGARSQRGYLVVVAEQGVQIHDATPDGLREVNTSSVPMRVANAQLAYRFREPNWSLALRPTERPAGVLVESFHLESLGEGMAYGSVAVNYVITGSPVDELHFFVPAELGKPEFVGHDVRRATNNGEHWTVKLQRKVIGDYNLGVTYARRYADGQPVMIGGVHCENVQTETGYIAVASHLNLQLTEPADLPGGLLKISREEMPGSYRLLVHSPLLRSFKYVNPVDEARLIVNAYQRGELVPAVIDVMQISSALALREDSQPESVTTIRYMIKNTSQQFLELNMPRDATVWSTRLIHNAPVPQANQAPQPQQASPGETGERVTASFDRERGVLMIPLKRKANPNDPVIVELEYGQVHQPLDWWTGQIALQAPQTMSPATFASWSVDAPTDWAVYPNGGQMRPDARPASNVDIGWLMQQVGGAWSQGLERWTSNLQPLFAGLAALALIVLCVVLFRAWLPDLLVGLGLVVAVWLGVLAISSIDLHARFGQPIDLSGLRFTEAVNVDSSRPMSVQVDVVPRWRQHVTMVGLIVGPVVFVVGMVGGWLIRPLRAPLWAAALVAGLYGAAQFPDTWIPLVHLLTWGIPLLLGALFVWRVLLRRVALAPRRVATAAAAMVLTGLLGGLAGCGTGPVVEPPTTQPVLERITVDCTADHDAIELAYNLKISATEPMRFALIGQQAVLLSDDQPHENITIVREADQHFVEVSEAGVYQISPRFLAPLPEAGDDQHRAFRCNMPMSLINQATLTVPRTGLQVESPTAIQLNTTEQDQGTVCTARLGPGDDLIFIWRPRARQTRLEQTSFYAELLSVFAFDTGAVTGRHRLTLQIAQGELDEVNLTMPRDTTVTAVEGPHVGAWRFDPATQRLEVKLSEPVAGEYRLNVVTQMAVSALPYAVSIEPIEVVGAVRQRARAGILSTSAVYATVQQQPQPINVDDFAREAAELVKAMSVASGSEIRRAFRVQVDDPALQVAVTEVTPELRATESGTFKVTDERLTYNAQLAVEVAKAGLFSIELTIPGGYDIDTLTSPQVSHWDQTELPDRSQQVQVHLRQKLLGTVPLNIVLSQPVAQMPQQLTVPRIGVSHVLKHTGQIVVTSERGVRLSVLDRPGTSELNPLEVGIRSPGVLVFKLLRPDWRLALATEIIQPRITNEFLHVARVSEGQVRHHVYLRYRIQNAGTKQLQLQLPEQAIGVTLSGAQIARRQALGQGRWLVELARKWFEETDGPYRLSVTYETRFDRTDGQVPIESVRADDAESSRGYLAIYANPRVQITEPGQLPPSVQSEESRTVPSHFGAGDLSGAALCYRSSDDQFDLHLSAQRHEAADQLTAKVQQTRITSVVTEQGQMISRLEMQLRVGSRRHLQVQLPDKAQLWSLSVNGRSVQPSRTTDASGQPPLLVPLAQGMESDMAVSIDLVYVQRGNGGGWLGRQELIGPKFDLPLNQIAWRMFLPDGYEYDDFEGTLTVDESLLDQPQVSRYDIRRYEAEVRRVNDYNTRLAAQYQQEAQQMLQAGRQYEARQMLEFGMNNSFADAGLNEDIRVDLHNLLKTQAKVGLVQNRARLREQTGQGAGAAAPAVPDDQPNFSQAQADQLEVSLNKPDSDNLDAITREIVDQQQAAAGADVHLLINVPERGRVLQFTRPLQVRPNSPMIVSFDTDRAISNELTYRGGWVIGLFVAFTFAGLAWMFAARRWDDWRAAVGRPIITPRYDEAGDEAVDDLGDTMPTDSTNPHEPDDPQAD